MLGIGNRGLEDRAEAVGGEDGRPRRARLVQQTVAALDGAVRIDYQRIGEVRGQRGPVLCRSEHHRQCLPDLRPHGLQVLGLTTQADFLAAAGLGELLVGLQNRPGMTFDEYVGARAAVMRMIDPGAMGRFRVLLLGKDVPEAAPSGFGLNL